MDKLRMSYINSLPQPFIVRFVGGDEWPVHDIDVETGLLRIDVCGMLQVKHIGEATMFRDADGTAHDAETFYSDYDQATVSAQRETEGRSPNCQGVGRPASGRTTPPTGSGAGSVSSRLKDLPDEPAERTT